MKNILITGCSGEMGYGLITRLANRYEQLNIVAIDIKKPNKSIISKISNFYHIDITDQNQLNELVSGNEFDTIFHLAAILSTQAAANESIAHNVNVNGSLNILRSIKTIEPCLVKFFFPSSIAVYNTSNESYDNPISEKQYCNPMTIYGAHKLYCEQIGSILDNKKIIDFRSIRFPGIISADTIPTGGTSDYGPEMLHAAVSGENYECFVRANSQIPFMTMPDAIESILSLMQTPKERLRLNVYNVRGFAPTAKDFELEIQKSFPHFNVSYIVNEKRQKMIDSWPYDIDDSLARADWSWIARYNLQTAFADYLVPKIKESYNK